MEVLWHSAVNVGIVIFSIVLAIACFIDKKPIRNSTLAFVVGVSMYGMNFYFSYADGACDFVDSHNLLEHLINAESCINSYSYDILIAQIAIIGAVLVWLAIAWRPVFRKLEQEESQEDERNET